MDQGGSKPPLLRALRQSGQEPAPFRRPGVRNWVLVTLAVLVLTTVLPIVWPATRPFFERTGPLLSLFFLVAAGGLWLGLGRRAFAASGAIVALFYVLTAWTPLAFDVDDFALVALLSSFGVFALAGFNLVFLLEEIVFDTHRLLDLRHPHWRYVPLAVVCALAVGQPLLWPPRDLPAPAVWYASLVGVAILGGWWIVRAFNPLREGTLLRELHLFTVGVLAIGAVTDAVGLLHEQRGILPSLLAYLLLVGTWIYVSYTTLQRTHFLLQSHDPGPWLCILLSASFALLNHAFLHFRLEGTAGVNVLLDQRVAYLIFGLWVGVGFYVVRNGWRVLRHLRDDRRLSPGGRIAAGRLARLMEDILVTERRLEDAAGRVYRSVDRALPGGPGGARRGWEFDAHEGGMRPLGTGDADAEE